MIKIVFSSDWHLGLKTDEVDRTDEIFGIAKQIVLHCKKLVTKYGKENVYLVLGGDLFDTNTPSEKHIAVFIKVLGLLKDNFINTFVMVGNHEAIADPNRLSCLSFIRAAKSGYPNVTLIDDIKTVKIGVFDTGPMYFTFLPHITKALIAKKVASKTLKKEITTQEYIDLKAKRISQKLGTTANNYIFSHLNVHGAHGGSEKNLLKKSEVYLPKVFTEPPLGHITPTIVQGHIHSKQKIGNIDIIGSPIYCSFGERLDDKCFAEYTYYGAFGKENTVVYPKANYVPFMALEMDMMNQTQSFLELPDVLEFLEEIEKFVNDGHKPFVKFDVTINPENNSYNWEEIRKDVEEEFGCTVKRIVPRIIAKRPVRSVKQKLGLAPKDSVRIYIKKNYKNDMTMGKRIWKAAQKYLEN